MSPLIKDDETFIRWEYFFGMGRFPNLKDPQTFNEKLQWLKLHYHPQQYTAMVDKYEVKELILNKIRGGGRVPYPLYISSPRLASGTDLRTLISRSFRASSSLNAPMIAAA